MLEGSEVRQAESGWGTSFSGHLIHDRILEFLVGFCLYANPFHNRSFRYGDKRLHNTSRPGENESRFSQ